ncbi:MAG: signal peptidase I, partial [Cyanobacteria bacterium]|nr:signal peptidase I [Cyanobacteriota bacterium]MDW8201391.1 signal peptidase I [Cyanobacteriota bacterium SKYGB_h_bin112]
GRWLSGLLFAVLQVVAVAIAGWSFLSPEGSTLMGLVGLMVGAFIYVASLFEAYRDISGASILSAAQSVSQRFDRWFAVFLSQLLPGLGQFYLHQTNLGTILMVVSVLLMTAATRRPVLVPLVAALAALSCYHAYRSAPAEKSWRREFSYLLMITTIVFVLRLSLGLLPTWLGQSVQLFKIPSNSMAPTLQLGDRILVSKAANYQPQPTDIVVFQILDTNPITGNSRRRFFVKRVIAIPGQTVAVQAGTVYRDQQAIVEPYVAEPPAYELPPARVPVNHYFVLGDNRNDSIDSHVWGFLPRSSIVGKAYKIALPLHRVKPL